MEGCLLSGPYRLEQPNAFGLYDMHGNVREWCHDYYGYDYYKLSPEKDPQGPPLGDNERRQRGGSWFDGSHYTRSAGRGRYDANSRYSPLGFRVVRELD